MNVNDPRWASIDAFVEENRDNILRDITRLVAVPSVEGAPEPGAPFGPGPKAALAKALEIADELGLDTFNADSYIGWAETGRIADGQKFLATITHTDVVPEGNGWDADPYTVRVRDGWLLGRGVADDKGPSILCLYALKYLKDSGAALKYPVRALLGANEETNMHDVDYYAEHYPMPASALRRTPSSRSATARRAASTASSSARSLRTASSRRSRAASPTTPCRTVPPARCRSARAHSSRPRA